MIVKKLVLLMLTLVLATACDSGGDDNGGNGNNNNNNNNNNGNNNQTGETYTYVVSKISLGSVNEATSPPTAPGFNLDGVNAAVCGVADYQNANGDGIDNQLIAVADAISGVSEMLDFDQSISDAVLEGTLLLLIRVSGVDDFTNDDSVTFEVLAGDFGNGVPTSTGGELDPGQVFDIETFSGGMTTIVSAPAAISNGVLSGDAAAIAIDFPVSGMQLNLEIKTGKVQFGITETALSDGVIGGKIVVADLLAELETFAASNDAIPGKAVLEPALNGNADLDDNGSGCTAISAAIEFKGVDAEEGMVLPEQ